MARLRKRLPYLEFTRPPTPTAPGPRGTLWAGVLGDIGDDPLAFFVNAAREHGGVVRLPAGPRPFAAVMHLISDPDALRHVLVGNRNNYRKSMTYEPVRYIVGDGLLTSDGEQWHSDRKGLQPTLTTQAALAMTPLITAAAADLAARWETAAEADEPIDLSADMADLTLTVIGRALLGVDMPATSSAIGADLTVLLRDTEARMNSLPGLVTLWNRFLPSPANLRSRRALRRLSHVAEDITDQAGRQDSPRPFMRALLAMCNEANGADRQHVLDQVLTFVLAGHETTASTLVFAWQSLCSRPDLWYRLTDEVDHVLGGEPVRPDHRPQLRYTDAVIQETMRLYPPAWVIERDAIEEDLIGGYVIPAKSIVIISPYVTHRLEHLWPEPETFRPERFLDGTEHARGGYIPFGLGPRSCAGAALASWEAIVLLAYLAKRFELEPVDLEPRPPEPAITLRPSGPVLMRVHSRRT